MIYSIYTDGSCRGNGTKQAVGAWAFLAQWDQKIMKTSKEFSITHPIYSKVDVVPDTTNQRMEMEAIIEACQWAHDEQKLEPFDEVHIYTDSAYVHNCFEQKWYSKWLVANWINSKKQPVANKDLWIKLIPFFENPQFYFHKVKGHDNDDLNNYVDNIVQTATARYLKDDCSN